MKLKDFFKNDFLDINLYKNSLSNSDVYHSVFSKILSKIFFKPFFKSKDIAMIKLKDDHQEFSGINISLYEGLGMLFSLLVYINKFFKADENIIKNIMSGIDQQYNAQKNTIKLSAFDGLGSLIYFSYNAYKITCDSYYYELFTKYFDDLVIMVENNDIKEYDVIEGLSGIVILLNNINEFEKDVKFDVAIDKLIKRLISIYDAEKELINPGFAHGSSGIILALFSTYKGNKNIELYNKAIEILSIENQKLNNLNLKNTWCNGNAGILMVRSQLCTILKENDKHLLLIRDIVDEVLNNTKEFKSFCLCHGYIGLIDIVNSLEKSEVFDEEQRERASELLKNVTGTFKNEVEINLGINREYNIDSFMLGTSGIAYTLMRLDYNLPTVLLLEIYK